MNLDLCLPSHSFVAGSLYIVGTPIGNLADISFRALSVLEKADIICAEDTRITQHLLMAYGIKNHLMSLREQNEMEMAQKVCNWLQEKKIVAQVSDAGMPAICDPGFRLVNFVRQAGFPVYVIPGPSALITALSISGVEANEFTFLGFLPSRKIEKSQILDKISKMQTVVVCYETPHRILYTLEELINKMPLRKLVLLRELTKTFETYLSGTAKELKEMLINDVNQQKGEMVIIFEKIEFDTDNLLLEKVKILAEELVKVFPIKKTLSLLSGVVDFNKKELYAYLLTKKNKNYSKMNK